MDSNLLTLYVTLKGLPFCSNLLEVPESKLIKHLVLPGSHNPLFHSKVIECIQSLYQASSLELTSEYFNIPEDLTRSLIDQTYYPSFLHIAKELLSRPSKSGCNKETQTSQEDPLQLPFKALPPLQTPLSKDLPKGNSSGVKVPLVKPSSSTPINVRKVVNVLLLTQHSPNTGLITNPDYSYTPTR